MTISFVGVNGYEATSGALPTHQAGDLILAFGWRTANAYPTVPSGWTTHTIRSGGTRSVQLSVLQADSSSEVSGTWTNSAAMLFAVYRHSTNYLVLGGKNHNAGSSSSTVNYAALVATTTVGQQLNNMETADSNAWVLGFGGITINNSTIETAPSGMTYRGGVVGASVTELVLHDTNAGVASWASTNAAATNAGDWATIVAELHDSGIVKSSGGLSPSLINSQALVRGIVI